MKSKRYMAMVTALCVCAAFAGCGNSSSESGSIAENSISVTESVSESSTSESTADSKAENTQTEVNEAVTNLSRIDMTKWQYNADDAVYYQVGISYCENPADVSYETLAVFVPAAYMNGTDNGDGTYTCELTAETVNGYTAETAPIVMPINTPGYSAMSALTDYSSSAKTYTDEGFVYVHAGCRGRDAGAPAGVTDLKAAVRYIRYCDDVIAGSAERIFTFGMSGGGAQSALMGATGDSELYTPYLEAIGAVQGVSDAVCGSMDWCPITNLDTADESYEWMMGVTRSGLSEEDQAISDALASAFADYINSAGIKDENGNVLTLEESADGIYQAGSYYDYIKSVIEESLNNFLSDTTFPYDASSSSKGGMGGHGGGKPDGDFGGEIPDDIKEKLDNGEMPEGGFGGRGSKETDSETTIEDIVIDLSQPNMQPLNNIGNNLVYSGSKQNVILTMCAGKVLYENGRFNIGEDAAVIYAKSNEIINNYR